MSVPVIQLFSLIFFVCLSVRVVENYSYNNDRMAPVVLVHGVGGSQIEGKWHTRGHPKGCEEKENDWKTFWMSLSYILTDKKNLICWAYRFQLLYDRAKHRVRNQDGVETRVPKNFGSCKPTEFLSNDPISKTKSDYYHHLIEALEKVGYNTDNSLKAAAYDWRYPPEQLREYHYFGQLAKLIETSAAVNKRKVALIAHSMGGLMMAYFLKNQPQAWKDKHIQVLITLGTPWLGSPKSFQTYLTGTDYGISTLKKSVMKPLVMSFPSVALLLPYEEEYKTTVLVDWTLKKKKYTGKDYQLFFKDVGFENGYLMRQDVRGLFPVALDKLGVRVYCVWSITPKHETIVKYNVNGEMWDENKMQAFFGPGDGTVPEKSLAYCDRFKTKGVVTHTMRGPDHTTMLFNGDLHQYLMSVLTRAQRFR